MSASLFFAIRLHQPALETIDLLRRELQVSLSNGPAFFQDGIELR